MENLYSWLIISSGAIIALLGSFLFASERELRNKRREFDELKRKQTAQPIDSLNEEERLKTHSSSEFITKNEELAKDNRQLLAANERLQREIADVHEHLETAQSQLAEFAERNQEAAASHEQLQTATSELNRQLEQKQVVLRDLQNAERRFSEIQSENQKLRLEQQSELENYRIQLKASQTRLQESARQNQEVSDRCARLETEALAFQQQLADSQSIAREMQSTRQQAANGESREMIDEEQQQNLAALVVDLERELSEGKNQVQVLADTHARLQETERVCQELSDENRRLGNEISGWQERLAANEESQRHVSMLRQQLEELQTEHARLIDGKSQDPEEIGAKFVQETVNAVAGTSSNLDKSLPANVDERMLPGIAISETTLLNYGSDDAHRKQSYVNSSGSAAGIHPAKKEEASWVVWTSLKQKQRLGAISAVVVVIVAGAVAMGFLRTPVSTSKEVTEPVERVEPVSKPQTRPAPRLRGTFETVRATEVYRGPNENSPLIANIAPGMKLNVVNSSNGWLEVRSKHGRPPGFIREEAAVRIDQK